jgi:hypothetical protein
MLACGKHKLRSEMRAMRGREERQEGQQTNFSFFLLLSSFFFEKAVLGLLSRKEGGKEK